MTGVLTGVAVGGSGMLVGSVVAVGVLVGRNTFSVGSRVGGGTGVRVQCGTGDPAATVTSVGAGVGRSVGPTTTGITVAGGGGGGDGNRHCARMTTTRSTTPNATSTDHGETGI